MNQQEIKEAKVGIVGPSFFLHWPNSMGTSPVLPRGGPGTVINLDHPLFKEWVHGQEHKLKFTNKKVTETEYIQMAKNQLSKYDSPTSSEVDTPEAPGDIVADNRDAAKEEDLEGKIMMPQEKPATRGKRRHG